MTMPKQIRKSGGSMILTIPTSMGLSVGDWMDFQKDNNKIVLTKVKFVADEEA